MHLSKILYHIFFHSSHHCTLPSQILRLVKVAMKIQLSVCYWLTMEVVVFHTTSKNQIMQLSSLVGYKDYNQPHFCLYQSANAKYKLKILTSQIQFVSSPSLFHIGLPQPLPKVLPLHYQMDYNFSRQRFHASATISSISGDLSKIFAGSNTIQCSIFNFQW